jgi:hypothetical protein
VTCEDLEFTCGTPQDNCGLPLNCGQCGLGAACGVGDAAGRCAPIVVENAILERGVHTGTVRGSHRFGLMFKDVIGTRIAPDGSRTSLFYGELKLKDGFYHVMPRIGPAE